MRRVPRCQAHDPSDTFHRMSHRLFPNIVPVADAFDHSFVYSTLSDCNQLLTTLSYMWFIYKFLMAVSQLAPGIFGVFGAF